ncbi:MAG: peptide deformylase [Pseudomonadota bacterium]
MNMRIYQLGEEGGESLRKIARNLTVKEIKSAKIRQLVEDMKVTMRTAPGVGLAAPQIGESLQIIVIEDNAARQNIFKPEILKERDRNLVNFHVMFNPELTQVTYDPLYFFEGCLSVKSCARITPRVEKVRVNYLDEEGQPQQVEAKGWYARILQHEVDHLHGRLYVDIADECTEVSLGGTSGSPWMNATKAEIMEYYHKCMAVSKKHKE